jgi:hypothetical protein
VLETGGLFHTETPEKDSDGRDDAEADREAPDGTKVVFAAAAKRNSERGCLYLAYYNLHPDHEQGNERGDDEAKVNHSV